MSAYLLLIPILLPIIGGYIVRFIKDNNQKLRKYISFGITVLTSILVWIFLFTISQDPACLIKFSDEINLSLKLDGLGKIFAGMLAVLWPFALLYSFAYMEDEERKEIYNSYYVMTYGVVLGIAFSGNLLIMFIFYELLTLITLPLIVHSFTKEAKKAGRYYLYFSLSGSSIALVGLIILALSAHTLDFIPGGVTTSLNGMAYLCCFFGFGVKAAIFPLCFWLPMAGAAPTPTTALLHAVAVVKAGAFAIMRITYYNFSYVAMNGTYVQIIAIAVAAFTIIFGSSYALKEQHFKRRLAYSTISNLSYIVLGTVLMSRVGFIAALLHLLYHSITKICLFFSCGAIIKNTGKHYLYIYQLNGLAHKMPIVFIFFTIAGFSVTGIPLFCGFVSKWYLCSAAVSSQSVMGYIGVAALIISALLTAMYTISISIRAFVYKPNELNQEIYQNAHEPNKLYLITIGVFAVLCIVFGVCSSPIVNIIGSLIGGIL